MATSGHQGQWEPAGIGDQKTPGTAPHPFSLLRHISSQWLPQHPQHNCHPLPHGNRCTAAVGLLNSAAALSPSAKLRSPILGHEAQHGALNPVDLSSAARPSHHIFLMPHLISLPPGFLQWALRDGSVPCDWHCSSAGSHWVSSDAQLAPKLTNVLYSTFLQLYILVVSQCVNLRTELLLTCSFCNILFTAHPALLLSTQDKEISQYAVE